MDNKGFYTVRGYEILEKIEHPLSHSMEDYLEMIYRQTLEEGYARINILAELLNIKASSATKMVQKLTKLGYLNYKKYGIIQLTEEGEKVGKFLLNRHMILENFLKNIGVEDNILINTELIEHNITVNALNRIEALNKFFNMYPDIFSKFREFKETLNNKK